MVQRGARSSEANTSSKTTDVTPSNVTNVGMANILSLLGVQQQLVRRIQGFNRYQMEWAKMEADLASEFSAKVAQARSLPAVLSACQEWNVRRIQSITEESQRFAEDSRDLATAAMRLMSKGGHDVN